VFTDRGEVAPERVGILLGEYDYLLLPTHGENFGHVIAEALRAGLPCVISDRTPWNGLEAAGAGWNIKLEAESLWRSTLLRCVATSPQAHKRLRENARTEWVCRAADADAANAHRRMIDEMLTSRKEC
jgi:glycosyltransferase involved in cell wall biosynthesis